MLAYNAATPGLVSVSFGAPAVTTTLTLDQQVRVTNLGADEATYDLQYTGITTIPGVHFSLPDGASVTVPAHGAATVRVRLNVDPAQMKHTHDPTLDSRQRTPEPLVERSVGLPQADPGQTNGHALAVAGTRCPTLRIPLYAAPRPASEMHASEQELRFVDNSTGQSSWRVVASPRAATSPAIRSRSSLRWSCKRSIPNEQAHPGDLHPAPNSVDLHYIGVTTNIRATQALDASELFFGIATYDRWSTPNEVEFDIYIDTNRDGEPDYVLYNTDGGSANGGDATDEFVTVLEDLNTGDEYIEDYLNGVPADRIDTTPFNTGVMVLPVFANDLGLTDTHAIFDYTVVSFSGNTDAPDDYSDRLTYDAAHPGLDFSGDLAAVTTYADLPGETIPARLDAAAYRNAHSLGVLLLHDQNAGLGYAETLPVVTGPPPTRLYLPLIDR